MMLRTNSFIRKRMISLATTATVGATSLAFAHGPTPAHHTHAPLVPIQYVSDRPDPGDEAPFLAENDAAMNKMMADMAVKPSGDVDRDFVAMMVPHHQGAIDMAQAVLRYGRNEQLRRLAQEIVVMHLAVGDALPPSVTSPTQPTPVPVSDPQPVPRGAINMSQDSMPHD